jgi:hypothetical protein
LSLVSGQIMTSGISFIAGGLQFTDGNDLSGLSIGDTFFNFDGDRQNRVRYDSPMFGPAQLSISAGADQNYDAAITFGGDYDHWTGMKFGPFTGLGAVSIAQPNEDDVDYRMAGSWSMLHDDTGLSLTLSGGFDGGTGGDTPYSVYGKLGWDTELVSYGPTGFGLDYGWTQNYDTEGNEGQSVGLAAIQVAPFVEQVRAEARALDGFQELLRDDRVGVDVGPVQGGHQAAMHGELVHFTTS